MRHHIINMLALAASLSLVGGGADAATYYGATLLGANENPVVNSPGSGTALLTLDGDFLTVSITFQNLLADTTASHIHCCAAAPANVGVATPTPTFPGFPLGVKSGSYTQTFDLTLASSYNTAFFNNNGASALGARAALIYGLNNNLAYVNVHTTTYPGGEIRGQLSAVPEPATWALMISGFGLVGSAARRRRTLLPA